MFTRCKHCTVLRRRSHDTTASAISCSSLRRCSSPFASSAILRRFRCRSCGETPAYASDCTSSACSAASASRPTMAAAMPSGIGWPPSSFTFEAFAPDCGRELFDVDNNVSRRDDRRENRSCRSVAATMSTGNSSCSTNCSAVASHWLSCDITTKGDDKSDKMYEPAWSTIARKRSATWRILDGAVAMMPLKPMRGVATNDMGRERRYSILIEPRRRPESGGCRAFTRMTRSVDSSRPHSTTISAASPFAGTRSHECSKGG
mmetsp:Transcript_16232/g.50828  ORF Transcript_16232/g.50828 Transcript_16232/m.50828 type:complete len:261 (-) Transcript_16232:685-1467(-)